MVVVENWLGTGRWSLPGGGVKRDESPVQAARREVYEEVGLMIDPARLRSLGEYTQRDHGLQFRYELFIVALPQRTALTPRPVEIRRAAWLKPSDIEEEMIGPSVREALRHWPA